MTEPVVAGLKAVGAAAGAAKSAAQGFSYARKRFRLLGTFDPRWLSISGSDEPEEGLTVADVHDIQLFLASPQMEPVLAFFAISKLSASSEETESVLQIAVTNEAQRWVAHTRGKWIGKLPYVIERLNAIYDGTTSHIHLSDELDNEVEYFSSFINAPVIIEKPDQKHANYIDRLMARMTDLEALVEVLTTNRNLSNVIAGVRLPPIATHTEIDGSFDFEALYVPRTFRRAGTNEAVSPDMLSPATSPFRVLIKGDPGAGKSTFVHHYRKRISSSTPGVPVVEVSCRLYHKTHWNKSILAYALEFIEAEHGMRISTEDFESMLLLGRICLVFDGLDEITQRQRRSKMVSRIESISAQYPMCSVLVTTRILGYEQASLPEALFDHLELDKFNHDQFEDYCARWFGLQRRTDLTPSFVSESDTVNDLRYNPLMLSLLCALYREHGTIPTDRRDVYRQCADLLFRRWDAHRQIEHDSSMPKFAERLMQEIAHLVYNSPTAQSGVGETQLVKILARFLQERGGYESNSAEHAAGEFVDFCAGRAWLLGSFGTDKRGNRVFAFTHRTFLEYFAAEAMTRRANSDDEVIEIIKSAYNRDRTSVVPELMIQAYDFRKDDGGPTVLRKMLDTGVSSVLLLRLMEGINVPSRLRSAVFQRIIDRGLTGPSGRLHTEEFDLLLNLNTQGREQFIEMFLTADSAVRHSSITRVICSAWATKSLQKSTGRLAAIWDPPIKSAALTLQRSRYWLPNAAIANWLALDGIAPKYLWRGVDAIICHHEGELLDGLLWRSIVSRFVSGDALPTNKATVDAIMEAYDALAASPTIPADLIRTFANRVRADGSSAVLRSRQSPTVTPWRFPNDPEELDWVLREVLIWVICAMREKLRRSEYLGGPIESNANGFWDGEIEHAIKLRSFTAATEPERARDPSLRLEADEVPSVHAFLASLPPWLRDWFFAKVDFVVEDDVDRFLASAMKYR